MCDDSRGNYAEVNGLNMYYEIHGTGQPLVLLHGAFSAIGTSFGQVLPELAKSRQAIAFELQVVIRRPDLVRKLVLASVTYTLGGVHPGLLDGLAEMKPEMMFGSPWHEEYMRIAPNPEDFATLFAKKTQMDREVRDLPAEAIEAIKVPTLLIIGDSDIVRPEHAVEMFRLLGGGVMGDLAGLPASQLAVLPGTTHATLPERGEWLGSMVDEFLDRPLPDA